MPSAFLQYGVEKGYFKKRKLDVKVQPSQGGATVIPSVVSGDIDIGGSNLVSVLLAQSKGVPVKIVAPGTFVRSKPAQDFSGDRRGQGQRHPLAQGPRGQDAGGEHAQERDRDHGQASRSRKQGVDVVEDQARRRSTSPTWSAAVEGGRVDAAFADRAVRERGGQGGRHGSSTGPTSAPGRACRSGATSPASSTWPRTATWSSASGRAWPRPPTAIEADPAAFREFLPKASQDPAARGEEGRAAHLEGRERPGLDRADRRADEALRRDQGEARHRGGAVAK